jgi:NTP pyrophosphatase (non-canonical NTP hydrolase)
MTFEEFQKRAEDTDRLSTHDSDPILVALLGLAGETGSLHTLYKKFLRDGDAFQLRRQRWTEELGDILWYLSAVASQMEISLEDVAVSNISKTSSRWLPTGEDDQTDFDSGFPEHERLPREWIADFVKVATPEGRVGSAVYVNGQKCGATLTDNSYYGDGYRFHDVIHMAFAAVLGWSPVFRALLKRKRKSDRTVDEVEDGGRAVAIEEGISALVFSYAIKHNYLEGVTTLDWPVLRTCHEMAADLEVGNRSLNEWEQAIFQGYEAWRRIQAEEGGRVQFDLASKTVRFLGPSDLRSEVLQEIIEEVQKEPTSTSEDRKD